MPTLYWIPIPYRSPSEMQKRFRAFWAACDTLVLRNNVGGTNQYRLTARHHVGLYETEVLSQRRAEAVQQYLIEAGIEPARIEATGYGESRPIANNKYAAGREQNRRVEFDIYLD